MSEFHPLILSLLLFSPSFHTDGEKKAGIITMQYNAV